MKKSKAVTPEPGSWAAYRRLLGYVRRYWTLALVSLFGFVVFAATQAAMAGLMEFLPDALAQTSLEPPRSWFVPEWVRQNLGSPQSYQVFLPLALIVIVIFRGIGSYLGGYYIQLVARNVVNRLRRDLFEHLIRLPGSFFSQRHSGQLLSTLTFNVEQVTGASTEALKVLVREGLTVIALLAYILYLNWKLSLIFVLVAPLIALVVSLASRQFRKYSRRIQDSMGGVTHVASESIQGFQEVRAFGGQEYELKRFQKASEYNLKQSVKMARVNEISTPVIQIFTFSALALLFYFGLSPELRGQMTTGDFLAYFTAASLIAKPLRQLTSVNSKLQQGIAAAQSLFTIMDLPLERDSGELELMDTQGEVEFRNLHFAYGDGKEVLRGINLIVHPGETLALVGRSGSGKSTLASLLPRFNDAPPNSVFLDGQPLEAYTLASLRKAIAVVNQQVVLFQDSVARNIAYGDLGDASQEEIRDAAVSAHALEFIEAMEQGFDTPIGENGVMLSGGQRQRLALARAFLKDAPVLILDEATSALDTESERAIQGALDAIMKGRTTLVIAHRLSTIENADRIAVLDEGKIVELGTHQQLLALNGAYAQLHRMQFAEPDNEL